MDIKKLDAANRLSAKLEAENKELNRLKRIINNMNWHRLNLEISEYGHKSEYISLPDDLSLLIVTKLIERKEKEIQEIEKEIEEL